MKPNRFGTISLRAAFIAGVLCCVCMGAAYKVVTNLQDLSNVKLPAAPTNGDALVYNSTLGAWTNGVVSGGGGGILTSNGFGTNVSIYSSGTTNRPIYINGGTQTNSNPVQIETTWNNAAVTFDAYNVAVTDTASGSSSTLSKWTVGGNTQMKLSKAGRLEVGASGVGAVFDGSGNATIASFVWITGTKVQLYDSGSLAWSSSLMYGAADIAMRRNAAGVLELDSGTTGIANRGTILAAKYTGRAGTSTASFNASGTVYQSITAVGNGGTGEDDLITQTIAANVLAVNGDRLRITSVVYFATNANNKEVKLYWNGVNIYTSTGGGAPSACTAVYETIITRTGAATQNIYTKVNSDDVNWTRSMASFVTGSAALSGAVTTKLTGEATDTNDIIQKELLVEYLPAP